MCCHDSFLGALIRHRGTKCFSRNLVREVRSEQVVRYTPGAHYFVPYGDFLALAKFFFDVVKQLFGEVDSSFWL